MRYLFGVERKFFGEIRRDATKPRALIVLWGRTN